MDVEEYLDTMSMRLTEEHQATWRHKNEELEGLVYRNMIYTACSECPLRYRNGYFSLLLPTQDKNSILTEYGDTDEVWKKVICFLERIIDQKDKNIPARVGDFNGLFIR